VQVSHRHHVAGRSANVLHAVHGHVHFHAGGDLCQRLHARRSRLSAVLHVCGAVCVFDDDAGFGQQFLLCMCFGRPWACAVICWSASGTKAGGGCGGKKAFMVNRVGDFGLPSGCFNLDDLRHIEFHVLPACLGCGHDGRWRVGQHRLANPGAVCHGRRVGGHLFAADGRCVRQKRAVSAHSGCPTPWKPHAG